MKRLILFFSLTFVFILFFNSKSLAYSQELANQVEENFFTYGAKGSAYSNPHLRSDVLQGIMNYWEENPNKQLFIYRVSNSNSDGCIYVCDNIQVNGNVISGGSGYRWSNCQWNNGNIFSFNSTTDVNNASGIIYDNTYLNMGTYTENNIDYSNVIYDPMIPTPDFSVTYIDIASNASAVFPLVVGLNNASDQYYVELTMENMTPSYIAITPSGDYEVKSYYQFASHIIARSSDLIESDSLSTGLLTGMLSAAWRSDISSYVLTDDNFGAKSNNIDGFANSVQYQAYKTAYLINRDIACFFGNITGLSCRYFVVRDGAVYGGKVKSWTNLYNIGFNESIPDYFVPYEDAQGYENETTSDIEPIDTDNPIVNPPANQTGKKTGLNISINIGSNVPNYPDYPTIATYNTDNLLVNAIDTAKQLPEFFNSSIGIFNELFNGLLPDPFWGIVMTGFLFSIVIMIIKVL